MVAALILLSSLLLLFLLFMGLMSINKQHSWGNRSGHKLALDGDGFPVGLRREHMPRHVAVIMDGSRRWAKQKGLSFIEGYRAGFIAIRTLLAMCNKWSIPVVSLFLFSSENWRRPQVEIDYLMQTFEEALRDEIAPFVKKGVRVSVIGDISSLPISLQEEIKRTENDTKNGTKCHLLMAMSYGGQNDIVQACQRIAAKVKNGLLEPQDITKALIEQELQTRVTNMPSPDILIRTSGEVRVSNYYLWQSAYTEMYFTSTLWPDFGMEEFVKALHSFQQRGRRFGQN